MLNLKLIVGSTRPSRAADRVAPWVLERARERPDFDVELLDLRDWPLPFFQEHPGSIGDPSDPTYSEPIVRLWNQTVGAGDAFLIVTTEYNHSVPGQLKNAIDNLWLSYALRNKPIGYVAYSGSAVAGARAVEHLALIAVEAEAVTLRNSVLIPFVREAFDTDGRPKNPATEIALGVLLEDLAWFGNALKAARDGGELEPGSRRTRARTAALTASG